MRKIIIFLMLLLFVCTKGTADNEIPMFVGDSKGIYHPRMKYKRKKAKRPRPLFEDYEETFIYPESKIVNEELKDFCVNTFIPVLKAEKFDIYKGVATMAIIDEDGRLYVQFHYTPDDGYIDFFDLPSDYESSFCILEGYPIKVEAPVNCPLLELTHNKYELKHLEGIAGTSDLPEWYFHLEGDSLVFDEVLFVYPLDKQYEGKTINIKTGRLE